MWSEKCDKIKVENINWTVTAMIDFEKLESKPGTNLSWNHSGRRMYISMFPKSSETYHLQREN